MNWNYNSSPIPRATFYRKRKIARNSSLSLETEESHSNEESFRQDLQTCSTSSEDDSSFETESVIGKEDSSNGKEEETLDVSDDEDEMEADVFFSSLIQQYSEEDKSKKIFEGMIT